MAQTFLPGVSRHEIEVFDPQRDNNALGVTLDRYRFCNEMNAKTSDFYS